MFKMTLCTLIAILAGPATAQHAHHGSDAPLEVGQSAFAALSEIVQILTDDPDTDWTKVNIQALRDHLVDMELVTTQAMAETWAEGQTVEFRATGAGQAAEAIERMILAHSPMLAEATGWGVTPEPAPGGATLRIIAATDAELDQVLGLGFFGVMTLGAHHQGHHLQLALGQDPHH